MAFCRAAKRPPLVHELIEDFESQIVPKKAYKRERSPTLRGGKNNFMISKIVFGYGPPELNLYKHVAKKTHSLWEMAKEHFILKDDGEPMDGFLVLHIDGENILENFLKKFDFEQEEESLQEACRKSTEQREIVFGVYLGETFWKTLNTASEETIKGTMTRVRKSRLFIMVVSDLEKNIAIDFCEKNKVCHLSHVISPSSDKRVFYEAFYDILDKNLKIFSSDLETRAQTRKVNSIKCKLDPLIGKLQTRKTKAKSSSLTKQCLEKLKNAIKYGVVGYRVIGKELYVFENMHLKTDALREKREQIEKSIKESFRGSVHFRLFHDVFKQHCAIQCGGYLQNNRNGFRGTIGMFGRLENIVTHDSMQTVAISSAHVISAGTVASLPGGERFGECIWPDNIETIHDVSVIKIDTSCLNILQTSILNERIQIEEISRDYLHDRKVFKYGAATERTEGFIEKVDDFEIYGSDVLVIVPKDSESQFSAKGDSGAIVLTRLHGKNYGIGMVYGGEFNIQNSENKSIQNETIAIFLKNALDRFVNDRRMAIQFDRI